MNLYVMHDGIGDVHGRYLQSDGNWTSDPVHARKFSSVADLNSAASTLGLTEYEPVQVDPAMVDAAQERMCREMESRRVGPRDWFYVVEIKVMRFGKGPVYAHATDAWTGNVMAAKQFEDEGSAYAYADAERFNVIGVRKVVDGVIQ